MTGSVSGLSQAKDPRALRLAWWIDGQFVPLARRFKPGSWPNRTIYRAGDYWWFWCCFKPMRRRRRA